VAALAHVLTAVTLPALAVQNLGVGFRRLCRGSRGKKHSTNKKAGGVFLIPIGFSNFDRIAPVSQITEISE
jgi:hypothetical protein